MIPRVSAYYVWNLRHSNTDTSPVLLVHPPERRNKWFEMIPGHRMADAQELKGAYVFLASNASTYMVRPNFPRHLRKITYTLCRLAQILLLMAATLCLE